MFDVFLQGREQEVLGDEGGELLQVELGHMLGEADEALSPVVLERPDGAVVLGFLRVKHDEGNETAAQALAEHDDAARSAVAVEERMDPLVEYMEADDVAIRGAGALAVSLKEAFDCPADIGRRGGGDAADAVGHRLPLACALPFPQHPMEALDQAGSERLAYGIEHEVEHAEMVAHLDDAVYGHRRARHDGPRFEDRTSLLLGQHAAFDLFGVERERDLVLPVEPTLDAILALGEERLQNGVANLLCGVFRHPGTFLDSASDIVANEANIKHSAKARIN